ncbi:MAG: glycosyltransferase [Bacteroidota bacterium]|nr:glycosyltransferase [Bacteroidota bacterium]
MRIAFVTSRFPYPVEKGDKLRAFYQIRHLSEMHEIHLVSLSHKAISQEDLDAMSPYCKSVRVFRINLLLLPVQIILGWIEGLPIQVSYFLDRTLKRKVQYHIIHIEPDHVICQLIRAAPYVRALPFTKTLDYMDVFSEGMRQLSSKHKLFGFFFRWEAERLSAFERTIYKDFDHHMIISEQERQRLKLPSKEMIAVIPNGVDDSFVISTSDHIPQYDLVFVGNLGYGPNKSAVDFLVHELLPALKKKRRNLSILIAGARPSAGIRQLHRPPEVIIKGWIPDIRDAYRDGRIFVAPMFSGLGLQNKILEAMSMGVPCVTTSMVNNAIGAKEGEQILVADTIETMVNHIESLLDHPDQYHRIATNARALIAAEYRWQDQVKKVEELIVSKNAYLYK